MKNSKNMEELNTADLTIRKHFAGANPLDVKVSSGSFRGEEGDRCNYADFEIKHRHDRGCLVVFIDGEKISFDSLTLKVTGDKLIKSVMDGLNFAHAALEHAVSLKGRDNV